MIKVLKKSIKILKKYAKNKKNLSMKNNKINSIKNVLLIRNKNQLLSKL
jgi:hypothetical protein